MPFHEVEAIAWAEDTQGGGVFRKNHIWALGCWFVWVFTEESKGALIVLDPLPLSEAIYAFGTADGLFETCLGDR